MTMNLITDPWIPAIRLSGTRELFGLRELFAEAENLRDIAVKPHERIALMRLLVCITQAALNGPHDETEWESCGSIIQSRVTEYLERWHDSFDLLGSGFRFLQVSGLKKVKESDEGNAISKLDLTLASGNNATLFDNAAGEERMIELGRTALNLLTFQCFSPGGRIGVALWNGKETAGKGSSNHAPCTPSSMLHSIILGPTLLETIRLNLLTRECVEDNYGVGGWGKPIWEEPPISGETKEAVKNATLTYLGRMAPLSRSIRLEDEGKSLTLANGIEYPICRAFREATATLIKRKDEVALLAASTSRSIWRQLPAITVRRRSGNDATGGPLTLSHMSTPSDTTLWVGALATDKAKIEDLLESVYVLPAGMFCELGRRAYEEGVAYAEEKEQTLNQAVKIYASKLKISPAPYERARQPFWTYVEQSLDRLFDLARNPDLVAKMAHSSWGQAVKRAAVAAYEQACAKETPRQIQAYVEGLRRLKSERKLLM